MSKTSAQLEQERREDTAAAVVAVKSQDVV
jgi:hypothetical protein